MNKTFFKAINLALDHELEKDSSTILFGLGVADAKGIFGTTTGLQKKYGKLRVFDSPLSENAMTGAALGMAMKKLRPILVHQRADFVFTSAEQLINQVAKTYFTSGGLINVPLTIRMIVGRGWGQGPTHAQSPHSLFGSIPGLKVVMPATPDDAYSMLRGAIQDPNPVIFIEHRWLFDNTSDSDLKNEFTHWDKSELLNKGNDLTLVGISYGVIEALKIAKVLGEFKVNCDVINLKSIYPLDLNKIMESVKKTKKLALIDVSYTEFGVTKTIIEKIVKNLWGTLTFPPEDFGLLRMPVPSSPKLASLVYPNILSIIKNLNKSFKLNLNENKIEETIQNLFPQKSLFEDQPDHGKVGPF